MMKTLNGKRIALSAILLCVLYLGYRIHESRSDAALLREQTLERAIPTVAVVSAKRGPATETITLPGNIVGWYEAPMYARVTGYVKMWYKDYGDLVKKDDILAEINAPDLDAEYQQARADLETERARYKLAEVTAKRWIALRPNHAVSEQSITVKEQELKAQAAVVNAAEQKVKNVEAFIRFKTIVAPFDGVVTQRNINVGDLVSKEGNLSTPNAKSNLFTVADVHVLRLFVSMPASFGPFLQPGLTADVAQGISAGARAENNPSAALLEGDRVRVVMPAPGYDLVNTPASESPQRAQVSHLPQAPAMSQSPQPVQSAPPQAAPVPQPPQGVQPEEPPQPPRAPHPAEPPQLPPNRVP